MRNSVKFGVTAAIAVLVGICGVLFVKYNQASTTLQSVRSEDEQTRGQYAQALGSIATIQDSLNAIVLGDEAVKLTSSNYRAERGMSAAQSDEVLDRIGELRAGIERSKTRIQDLDEHLRKSGMKIGGLEKMIASLRRTVVKKETMIADLVARVDSLSTEVTGLTASVEQKQHELGTVYCLIGTKQDLTTAGAVVATGGLLGIGKTLKPTGNVDETLCTVLDTDQETTLDIPGRKAQVLSAQPTSSYALEPSGDHTVLRILDPMEFRKIRHLVIVKTA